MSIKVLIINRLIFKINIMCVLLKKKKRKERKNEWKIETKEESKTLVFKCFLALL